MPPPTPYPPKQQTQKQTNKTPKPRCAILVPGGCEYVTLHGKRDFEDVNQLRILRWEDYPGLSGQVQCNTKGDKRVGVSVSDGDGMMGGSRGQGDVRMGP